MRNYVQPGNTVTLTAPTGGVASGDGVLVGTLFGVAAYDAAAGGEVEVELVGVFELAKASGAISEGQKTYWDATNKVVTTTATGNTLVGAAVRAAASGATTARVRLNGVTT
jgi:predicted RecA/RadA family phage recombinase